MTEIEKREQRIPVNVGMPLNGLDEAFRLSQNLAVASLLPDSLRGKPSDVLAIVLYGQELGLAPMQAIQGIYVVKGKPQLSATLWTALARRQGHKVKWGERTNTSATVTITRADDPESPLTETFTLDDAVAAGLCSIRDGKPYARSQNGKPTPWENYTRTMLANRAISNAGKLQCPEVALGFAIEGDYDYVQDDAAAVVVTPPEHHSDIVDAVEVSESEQAPVTSDDLAGIAAEYEQPTLVTDGA